MVHGKIGFRFKTQIKRANPVLIEQLKKYPAPNIGDAMERFYIMDAGIKPVKQDMFIAGPAVTVMMRPGDNLMLQKALELVQPGDVLVVNTCGNTSNAIWGGLMTQMAVKVGLAGVIIDGSLRDVDDILAYNFQAFSRAIVACGCDREGPGEINYPIVCGGVVVNPGDIIIASHDGVAVIPQEDAVEVLEATDKVFQREEQRVAEINAGNLFPGYVDAVLRQNNVIIN